MSMRRSQPHHTIYTLHYTHYNTFTTHHVQHYYTHLMDMDSYYTSTIHYGMAILASLAIALL